jgi:transcriptional regulator with GAF, ATPase, and Fis domain
MHTIGSRSFLMKPRSMKPKCPAKLLETLVQGTATETGKDFFPALVMNLCNAMEVDHAWVTRLSDPDTLQTISFFSKGNLLENFTYPVAGTPCETVLFSGGLVQISTDAKGRYPSDPWLRKNEVESYLGVPIIADDGELLGHLSVAHSSEIPAIEQLYLFRVFAARAGAELKRIYATEELAHSREVLQSIVDSTVDAIISFETDFSVRFKNDAAAEIFEYDPDDFPTSVEQLICAGSRAALPGLLAQLSEDTPAFILPAGLQGMRRDKRRFSVTGSISRFVLDGNTHFLLVLRDEESPQAARQVVNRLQERTSYLEEELSARFVTRTLVGESAPMVKVRRQIEQVAGTAATVLVQGETGTGKELVAQAIHDASSRASGPMIRVNCAALPGELIESELFGHERGAFTGATEKRAGRFALADGGTLFLDEIGELPIKVQAKLLRALQEGEFETIGSTTPRMVDVRVVAATNRRLTDMVEAGTFREDLYYRLAVFPISMPPLRDRGADVSLLAELFADRLKINPGLRYRFEPAELAKLQSYSWPGNVRELRNLVERAAIVSADGKLRLDIPIGTTMPEPVAARDEEAPILSQEELTALERDNLKRALERCAGRVSGPNGAAKLLGIPASTLTSRMRKLGF